MVAEIAAARWLPVDHAKTQRKRGVPMLSGAPVVAHDIRAGAALVLAGLAGQGVTTVAESQHIDRGYPSFAEVLAGLGADVVRVAV